MFLTDSVVRNLDRISGSPLLHYVWEDLNLGVTRQLGTRIIRRLIHSTSSTWAEVTQRLGVLSRESMGSLPVWLGSCTVWQPKGSQTHYVEVQGSRPGLHSRSCIAFYDTALEVIQQIFHHTLLVQVIISLPRPKGRRISLHLLIGECQDLTVDDYVGQDILLQSS